jgi:signal peptidase I
MTPTKQPANQPAQEQPAKAPVRRSEKEGLLHFGREMTWALLMAFVFIVYVIQAFKIPTGSMENSLLVGDFLLGLKFMYGSPILPRQDDFGITTRFPGLTNPKPGDVIIFRYPGTDKKDYIKRCVAGPGQTLRVSGKLLIVDNDTMVMPPLGQHVYGGMLPSPSRQVEMVRWVLGVKGRDTMRVADGAKGYDTLIERMQRAVITDSDTMLLPPGDTARLNGRIVAVGERVLDERLVYFAPLRIPARGDTIAPASLPVREFVFLRSLVRQENPRSKVTTEFQLYVDGEFANSRRFRLPGTDQTASMSDIDWDRWEHIDNWIAVDEMLRHVCERFEGAKIDIRKRLLLDGKPVDHYVVKKDNYFMMGDNRDNSLDSRYWGYLNRTNVKAKAFILYFSWNSYRWCPHCRTCRAPDGHFYDANNSEMYCRVCGTALRSSAPLYMKIRWNRIGKLIRAWDGLPRARTQAQ